jgi:hypothetical protein
MTELEDNVTLCKKSWKISKGQKQKVKNSIVALVLMIAARNRI